MTHVEQALVGSLLLNPKRIPEVVDLVNTADFTDSTARKCYENLCHLWKSGEHIDNTTVLMKDIKLAAWVAESTSNGSPLGALRYAQDIAEASRERRILNQINQIRQTKGADEKLERLLRICHDERAEIKKDPSIKAVLSRFRKHTAINKKRGSIGASTGIMGLQRKNIEYAGGHIWVVGGWTSTGKTAVMIEKVRKLLRADRAVGIISTEMTEYQVMSRILSSQTGVSGYRILTQGYHNGEQELVDPTMQQLENKNLVIWDNIYDIGKIETAARRARAANGLDVLFIDYVQNCRVQGLVRSYDVQSTLAKQLQELAKALDITIVCLSQVSNIVGRGDVDQAEFKGAGEWSAVADISVMLRRSKDDETILLYEVAKNRHGPLTEFKLQFAGNFSRLEEIV
jgi:replicative DNA helicase